MATTGYHVLLPRIGKRRKLAAHADIRSIERTDLKSHELRDLRDVIKTLSLSPSKEYHYKWPGNRGYGVIGPASEGGHVLKTVLSPHMHPPGRLLRIPSLNKPKKKKRRRRKRKKTAAKDKVFYHGSRQPLTSLRTGSHVTPYQDDALTFAVPWSTAELAHTGGPDGRPPKRLQFRGKPPKDHPIYLYEVTAPTRKAATNTGALYGWNRVTTGEAKIRLVKTVASWHSRLLSETGSLRKTAAEFAPGGGTEGGKSTYWSKPENLLLYSYPGRRDIAVVTGDIPSDGGGVSKLYALVPADTKEVNIEDILASTVVTPNSLAGVKTLGISEVMAHYVPPPRRRKGYGGALMRVVAGSHRDQYLVAKPDPFKDRAVPREKLKDVYRSYGFIDVDRYPYQGREASVMVLPPSARPTGKYKAAEFAPGIPDRNKMHDLPKLKKPKVWEYGVHDHHAERRGRHLDLRLGDPRTGRAHSWAVVGKMPEPGESTWAIQQPTHTLKYMDFKGRIPEGYGAGKVDLADRAKTEIVNSRPGHISFNIYRGRGPEEYTLHDIGGNRWKFYNRTLKRDAVDGLPDAKPKYRNMEPPKVKMDDDNQAMTAKIDGAHNLFIFPKPGKRVRVLSYRPSERKTGVIEHTHKVPRIRDGLLAERDTSRTILRGELYAMDPRTGKALVAKDLGGILNSNVWKSREKQKEMGKLRSVLFDVVRYRGKDMSDAPYDQKWEVLQKIVKKHPKVFELPRIARTEKEKQKLYNAIQRGDIKETNEGVVMWDRNTGKSPIKAKFRPEHDVYIRSLFPGGGKYKDRGVGGFSYSHTPSGDIVGRVGTGLSDKQREHMHKHPELYKGIVAKVRALDIYSKDGKPGALRAPAFLDYHLDKNSQGRLDELFR